MTVVSNPASFRAAARWQRVCAVCGAAGSFHAHHVAPKQLLRRLKLPRHDTRAALRLCDHCHMQYEWGGPGKRQIPIRCLTDDNICYLYDVLGVTVVQIERKYEGDFNYDPRWHKHRMGECERCQLSLRHQTTV